MHSGADTSNSSALQSTSAGTKLKKNDALWTSNIGTDDYGFSALPGGIRDGAGSFNRIRDDAWFWSTTVSYGSFAFDRILFATNGNVNRGSDDEQIGASVRCLRD